MLRPMISIAITPHTIDSKPSARAADVKGATNYVNQALGEALAGKPVSVSATQPYGCSVKYSSM